MNNKQPVVNELSDSELLIGYRNGDEDAFRRIVTRYKDPLYTFLRQLVNHFEIVENVFQETFLQLYANRDRFDTNHPLRPWLFTIAADKAEVALRKIPRRSRMSMSTPSDADDFSINDAVKVLPSRKITQDLESHKGEN